MDDSKKLLNGHFFYYLRKIKTSYTTTICHKEETEKPAVYISVSGLIKSEMLHNYICRLV